MLYFLALSVPVLIALLVIWRLTRVTLTPRETYTKPRPGMRGRITYCQHCDCVVTERNFTEHGSNCAKRPAS